MLCVCRHANEKLGNKIREQSKAIMQLTAEKEYVTLTVHTACLNSKITWHSMVSYIGFNICLKKEDFISS